MKHTGVYIITNLVNGKNYIGYSENILERFTYHRQDLVSGRHKNYHLQAAWHKYGEENFNFSILDECSTEELSAIEHLWVMLLNTRNEEFGYNLAYTSICDIFRVSPEARKKGALTRKGRKLTAETRKKMSKAQKALKKTISTEHRALLSKLWKGKMSGANNPAYGIKISRDVVERLRLRRIKPILQLDEEKNIIREWSGGALQIKNELGIPTSSLSKKCRQDIKYKNYFWKYKNQ